MKQLLSKCVIGLIATFAFSTVTLASAIINGEQMSLSEPTASSDASADNSNAGGGAGGDDTNAANTAPQASSLVGSVIHTQIAQVPGANTTTTNSSLQSAGVNETTTAIQGHVGAH